MAGYVLRRNIFALFEVCALYEHLWFKSAKPPTDKASNFLIKWIILQIEKKSIE